MHPVDPTTNNLGWKRTIWTFGPERWRGDSVLGCGGFWCTGNRSDNTNGRYVLIMLEIGLVVVVLILIVKVLRSDEWKNNR